MVFILQQEPEQMHYELEGIPEDGASVSFQIKKPLKIVVDSLPNGEETLLKGHISGMVQTHCDRCLKEMEYPISLDFQEVFREDANEENEAYPIFERQLVLDKMVMDLISMEMPFVICCDPNCKGICPICGANRNLQVCDCSQKEKEKNMIEANPFSKLKGMFD